MTEGLLVRVAVVVELAGLVSGFLARVLVVAEWVGRAVVDDVGRVAVRPEAAVGAEGFVIPALARAATVLVADVAAGRAVPEDVVLSDAVVVVLGRVLGVAIVAVGLDTLPFAPGLVGTNALEAAVFLAAAEVVVAEPEAGFEVEGTVVLVAAVPGLTGAREGRDSRAEEAVSAATLGGGEGFGAPAPKTPLLSTFLTPLVVSFLSLGSTPFAFSTGSSSSPSLAWGIASVAASPLSSDVTSSIAVSAGLWAASLLVMCSSSAALISSFPNSSPTS